MQPVPPPAELPEIQALPTSLDDVAAERRPAVRAALESIQQLSASIPPLDAGQDAVHGDPAQPLTAPAGVALPRPEPAPVSASKFGAVARRPGANLPQTALTSSSAAAEPAAETERSPDVVRRSLSGFQSGTSRADQHGAEQ